MAKLILSGGRVIDPANKRDGIFDVVIENGLIRDVAAPRNGKSGAGSTNGAKVVDVSGQIVSPGLVDLHTHLRQPGREDKETIETGLSAALAGGFTDVCAMPNTEPAIDNHGVVEMVRQESLRLNLAAAHVIGAITKGRQGKELTDFGELFDAGCIALSDDGNPLADSLLMRRALEYARIYGRPIIQHAEDPRLFVGGVMHEGLVATRLGLRGIPSESEAVIVARDLALAQLTGGWVHFAHLSSAEAVELVRTAKRNGIRVTCEVTPHHLALTDDAVGEFNTDAKVNPPLREEHDRQALIEGLKDGTIDCIATDHAPHTAWEKEADFDAAPFGISGLETALAICAGELIKPGGLTWLQLVDRLSVQPAKIAGLPSRALTAGAEANITVIDADKAWTVEPSRFASKGRNTPFAGTQAVGVVSLTIRRGEVVYEALP